MLREAYTWELKSVRQMNCLTYAYNPLRLRLRRVERFQRISYELNIPLFRYDNVDAAEMWGSPADSVVASSCINSSLCSLISWGIRIHCLDISSVMRSVAQHSTP